MQDKHARQALPPCKKNMQAVDFFISATILSDRLFAHLFSSEIKRIKYVNPPYRQENMNLFSQNFRSKQ